MDGIDIDGVVNRLQGVEVLPQVRELVAGIHLSFHFPEVLLEAYVHPFLHGVMDETDHHKERGGADEYYHNFAVLCRSGGDDLYVSEGACYEGEGQGPDVVITECLGDQIHLARYQHHTDNKPRQPDYGHAGELEEPVGAEVSCPDASSHENGGQEQHARKEQGEVAPVEAEHVLSVVCAKAEGYSQYPEADDRLVRELHRHVDPVDQSKAEGDDGEIEKEESHVVPVEGYHFHLEEYEKGRPDYHSKYPQREPLEIVDGASLPKFEYFRELSH